MKNVNIIHLPYRGDNLEYLKAITDLTGHLNLYRASELSELWRVLKYGTDRGGFPRGKKVENTEFLYENVIFGTTEETIIKAESDPALSSSFKKFSIIPDPVLLVYDVNKFFEMLGFTNQWLFMDTIRKLDALKHIIIL